jgi:hypothetical protein
MAIGRREDFEIEVLLELLEDELDLPSEAIVGACPDARISDERLRA